MTRINSIIGPVFILVVLLCAVAGWSQDSGYMDGYTGADADTIGTDGCLMCHRDKAPGDEPTHVAALEAEDSDYVGMSCEKCHGPGGEHYGKVEGILNPAKMPGDELTKTCTQCHEEKGIFKLSEWEESKHMEVGNTCADCHSGHTGNDKFLVEDEVAKVCNQCHEDKVTALTEGTHGAEGVSCETCHNPHQ